MRTEIRTQFPIISKMITITVFRISYKLRTQAGRREDLRELELDHKRRLHQEDLKVEVRSHPNTMLELKRKRKLHRRIGRIKTRIIFQMFLDRKSVV